MMTTAVLHYARSRHWLFSAMAAFVLFAHPLSAQIPAGDEALAGGFHQLYDLDFAGAQKAFALYQVSNPEDPRGQVAVATGLLFAECHRLGVLE